MSRFSWEVVLPERQSLTLGQRPKAVLHIESDARGTEDLRVPLAVAKLLLARRKSELIDPRSRAELLYELGRAQELCAKSRVERLIDKRDYSSSELRGKLRDDGYPPKLIEEVVLRSSECGLVDDARFADVFIRSKLSSGWGKARIARELELKGIDPDTVDGWPEEFFSDESEFERALTLARRKRLTGKNDYEKLMRSLMSKGFSGHVSHVVSCQVIDESTGDDESSFE